MDDKNKFFSTIAQFPRIAAVFDQQKQNYDPIALDKYMCTCSKGERILMEFFLAVWIHHSDHPRYPFDFTDAAAHLDREALDIIINWLVEPFWP